MSELTENSHLQSNITMPVIRGEIALIVIILINSLGVVLMLYSGSGISAISSVPYAFSLVVPKISLGTWTYIFQGLLVLSLMICIILGHLDGLGIGTILAAFTMGKVIGMIGDQMDRHVRFESFMTKRTA